jgi:hypothetical protein
MIDYDTARILFDAMWPAQQVRVLCDFEQLRWSYKCDHAAGVCGMRDAFTRAVADEVREIEREMLIKQDVGGTA